MYVTSWPAIGDIRYRERTERRLCAGPRDCNGSRSKAVVESNAGGPTKQAPSHLERRTESLDVA